MPLARTALTRVTAAQQVREWVPVSEAFMTEQNRKTLKSFYCRDYLWELFEVMARDLGCSMDYLINEAMRHYARSRNYSLATGRSQPISRPDFAVAPPGGPVATQPQPTPFPPLSASPGPPPGTYPGPGAFAVRGPVGGPVATPPYDGHLPTQSRLTPFGAPPAPTGSDYFPPAVTPPPYLPGGPASYDGRAGTAPPGLSPGYPASPPVPGIAPPPMPGAGPPPGGGPAVAQPPLFLLFQGQKYRIDKEKFIIGRGSQMTDLTIRDGNISRKHAAVIYRSGKYFIKDLDSTNGIDYQGSRIDSKKIEEGDTFHICDYEFRFTYR
jgi:hypothetical protein